MKYEVYMGIYKNEVVYIGEGKEGRSSHLNSGISHVYQANKLHFADGVVKIEIVETFNTKEEAKRLELKLIEEMNPEWNVIKKNAGKTFKKNVERALSFMDSNSTARRLLLALVPKLRDNCGEYVITNEMFNPGSSSSLSQLEHRFRNKQSSTLTNLFESFEKVGIGVYRVVFTQQFKDNSVGMVRNNKVR